MFHFFIVERNFTLWEKFMSLVLKEQWRLFSAPDWRTDYRTILSFLRSMDSNGMLVLVLMMADINLAFISKQFLHALFADILPAYPKAHIRQPILMQIMINMGTPHNDIFFCRGNILSYSTQVLTKRHCYSRKNNILVLWTITKNLSQLPIFWAQKRKPNKNLFAY